jgi:hypothetical protein
VAAHDDGSDNAPPAPGALEGPLRHCCNII